MNAIRHLIVVKHCPPVALVHIILHLHHMLSLTSDGGGHAGHPGRPDHGRLLQHRGLQPQRALLERGPGAGLLHPGGRGQVVHQGDQTQRR